MRTRAALGTSFKSWNVPWRFVSVLSQPAALVPAGARARRHRRRRDRRLARDVDANYGGETRVLAGSIIECVDRVVAPPAAGQQVTALSGDGQLLTYSLAPSATRGTSSVDSSGALGRRRDRRAARPHARAVGGRGRDAALGSSGLVTLSAPGNRSSAGIDVGRARAIALHGSTSSR